MSKSTHCPSCRNEFLLPEGGYEAVNCPFCNQYIEVASQQVPQRAAAPPQQRPVQQIYSQVAPSRVSPAGNFAPAAPKSKRGLWITLGLMFGGVLMLASVISCGGVIYWFQMRESSPPPTQVASDDSWPGDTPTVDNSGDENVLDSRTPQTPEVASAAAGSATSSASLRYNFKKDKVYIYSFHVNSKLGDNDVTISGANSYSLSVRPNSDIPAKYRDSEVYTLLSFNTHHSTDVSSSDRFSIPMPSLHDRNQRSGQIVSNRSGEILHVSESDDALSSMYQQEPSTILPIIMQPTESLGIEDFGYTSQKKWSRASTLTLYSIEEPQSRYPLPQSPFGRPYIRDPLGRGRTKVKTSTSAVRVDYEILSQDSKEIKVRKKISITPEEDDDSSLSFSLDVEGVVTFDRTEGVVSKIELKGESKNSTDNVTVKFPVTYSCQLMFADGIEKLKEERENERELADNTSSGGGSPGATGSSSAARKSEPAPENPGEVIAEFPDMGWGVKSLAFSPDSRFLFAGKQDRTLFVFDLQKKQKIGTHKDLDSLSQVTALAVSPDGKKLLSGGYTGRIEVWDIAENGLLTPAGSFVGHTSEIKSIAISPDGKYALSGERESRARMWTIDNQREVLAVGEFDNAVEGVCFTPDGKQAFAADREVFVKIDVAKVEVAEVRKDYRKYLAHDMAFSSNAELLACSEGSSIQIYATDTASEIGKLKGSSGVNWVCAFHPDGKHLFTGSGNVRIWNVDSQSLVDQIDVRKHVNIQTIAINRDGSMFATIPSNAGATLKVYKSPIPAVDPGRLAIATPSAEKPSLAEATPDVEKPADDTTSPKPGQELAKFPDQTWGIKAACFSPDGNILFAGKFDTQVLVFDVNRKRLIGTYEDIKSMGRPKRMVATRQGDRLLTGGDQGPIFIWDVAENGLMTSTKRFVGHSAEVMSLAVSPDGKVAISGDSDKRARLWSVESARELKTIAEFDAAVLGAAFSADGKTAYACDGKTLATIDVATEKVKTIQIGTSRSTPYAVEFSDDGSIFACSFSYDIQVYKTADTGMNFKLESREIHRQLRFTPDNRFLAAGERNAVIFWELKSRGRVRDIPTSSETQALCFSPDSKRVALTSEPLGGTLHVYQTPIED